MDNTEILLEKHMDWFGLKDDKVFNHHSKDWNIATLRVYTPIKLEMDQSRFYTDVKLYMTDNILQLEKLLHWSKALTKGVDIHIKNLKANLVDEVEKEEV
mgnify:FL=1|jgi:hypothetical protein